MWWVNELDEIIFFHALICKILQPAGVAEKVTLDLIASQLSPCVQALYGFYALGVQYVAQFGPWGDSFDLGKEAVTPRHLLPGCTFQFTKPRLYRLISKIDSCGILAERQRSNFKPE